jgi:hypothetical protein
MDNKKPEFAHLEMSELKILHATHKNSRRTARCSPTV